MRAIVHSPGTTGLSAETAEAARSAVTPRVTAAVIGAYFALSVALVFSLSIQLPQAGLQTVLVFAPGTNQAEALDALHEHGGNFVAFGVSASVVVARFENDLAWSDLHAMNAWLSFDSTSLVGCFVAADT